MSGTSAATIEQAITAAVAACTVPVELFGISAMTRRILAGESSSWGHLDFDVTIGPSVSPDRDRPGSHVQTAFRVLFAYNLASSIGGQIEDLRNARKQAEIVAGASLVDLTDGGGASVVLERIDTVLAPEQSRILCTVDLTATHPLYAP